MVNTIKRTLEFSGFLVLFIIFTHDLIQSSVKSVKAFLLASVDFEVLVAHQVMKMKRKWTSLFCNAALDRLSPGILPAIQEMPYVIAKLALAFPDLILVTNACNTSNCFSCLHNQLHFCIVNKKFLLDLA